MHFHFTKHAIRKFTLLEQYGFDISITKIKKIITKPLRLEEKHDGTFIATELIDKTHVLRIVYRLENDIIIIITFYPGRRKAYGI